MRGPMRGSSVDYEAVARSSADDAIEALTRETVRRISRRRTKLVSEEMSAAKAVKLPM